MGTTLIWPERRPEGWIYARCNLQKSRGAGRAIAVTSLLGNACGQLHDAESAASPGLRHR